MRSGASRLLALAIVFYATTASAQLTGFQLNRYEPTPSGSWFFLVEHPYYSSVRGLAAGLNLSYAHQPLRYGETDPARSGLDNIHPIIANQLIAHLDFTATIRDRVMLNISLPLVLFENGQTTFDVSPINTVTVSDPRLMGTVRLRGQPHLDKWSIHASLAVWFPLRAVAGSLPQQTSDAGARIKGSVLFAGVYKSLIWSGTFGLMYRSPAQIGMGLQPDGTTVGPEVQIGLAAGLFLPATRLVVGPEFLFATSLLPSQAMTAPFTSMELLVGAQYNIAKLIQVGLAGGLGFLTAPGTPDGRVLLRVSYAPVTRDRDQDGIPDVQDACPDQKGVRSEVPSNNGCPLIPDKDCDGVPDTDDECPDDPEGKRPDPIHIGCPFTSASKRLDIPPPAPLPATTPAPGGEPPPAVDQGRRNGL